MKLAVWTPLPPSPSGIADYAAEQLVVLATEFDVCAVVEDPSAVTAPAGVTLAAAEQPPAADLDLYQLGNSPAHAFVYRAALARPGVVLLHDWVLQHLVLAATLERGDRTGYLREMRHAHGAPGSFAGRQIARALGGTWLPTLFPLNRRVLEAALGVVCLSRSLQAQVAARLGARPSLHLPHHLCLPCDPPPERAAARRALGVPDDILLLVAPGLATRSKRLEVAVGALARARARHPHLRLVVAGALEPELPLAAWTAQAGVEDAVQVTGRLGLEDFVRWLCAADLVWALRFPSHGEMSGALVRALGVGRAALVSAGTPPADEFGDDWVVAVDPGVREAAQLDALLEALLGRPELRERLERSAREHVRREHALRPGVVRLAAFLRDVHARADALRALLPARHAPPGSLAETLVDELRFAAYELGLEGLPVELEQRAVELASPAAGAAGTGR